MALTVTCYRAGSVPFAAPPDTISELIETSEAVLWIDVVDSDRTELDKLAAELSLHPLAIEDAIERHQRPKLETFPSHAFAVVYSRKLTEVALFIGPTWIVTVRSSSNGAMWDPEAARRRITRHDGVDVGLLVYLILDEIVDGYFDEIDEHEERLESIEERVFGEMLADERGIQQELFQVRRELMVFRRAVVPMREVVGAFLRNEVRWVRDEPAVLLQDVYDHVLRAIDLIDGQRELMGNAVDAHLAIISNRMNQVMKKLTAWGAILFAATIIAGIYGMNFADMPELSWTFGYPFALGLMGTVTLVLYFIFRRRDWL